MRPYLQTTLNLWWKITWNNKIKPYVVSFTVISRYIQQKRSLSARHLHASPLIWNFWLHFFIILKCNLIIYAAGEKSILIPEYVISFSVSLLITINEARGCDGKISIFFRWTPRASVIFWPLFRCQITNSFYISRLCFSTLFNFIHQKCKNFNPGAMFVQTPSSEAMFFNEIPRFCAVDSQD